MELVERLELFLFEEIVDAAEVLADLSSAKLVDFLHEAVKEVAVVAHHNDRAVEGEDGFLEHVLGAHVEVVRGFVEDEEVDGLEQQLDHGQARALAAREHFHLLVRGFAAEHEGTEYVAYLQADVALGHAVDGVENGELAVEELRLVLGVVAQLDVVAELEVALEGNFTHDALDEGRLAFAVLAHEGHFLAALDGKIDLGEDAVGAVVLAHVFADEGIVAGTRAGRELQVETGVVHLVDLDGDYLFELLDAALHLYGLGGLVAETLNEVLDVGDFLLLVFVGSELLLAALGAETHELVVLHLVVRDAAAADFERAVGDVVDEGAVVAHEHHGTGFAAQELFQPADALDVEVVGGFVEQKHVGAAQEELGQLDAHAPATGELAGGPVEVGGGKAQALERALEFGVVVQAAHHVEALALVGEAFHQLHVGSTFVVGALGQLRVESVDAFLELADVLKSLFGLFAYGVFVAEDHHLGQVADGAVVLERHGASRGLLQAGKDFE